MKYRILSALLTLCLAFSPLCQTALAAGSVREETMAALGIVSAESGTDSTVTRGRFAQMLVNASTSRDSAEGYGASLYRDLKKDHPCSGAVRIAVEQGWMSGFLDGSFRPDQAVTLEEACASLLKLLGYDDAALKGAYPTAQLTKAASLSAVQRYDVYYYNANMGAVWVYRQRPAGTITALSPSAAAPTSVTLAGVSYAIGTAEAAYQLSSQGSFQEGDVVTLLLGMNGEVVRVVDVQENEAVYYGSVVSSGKAASTASTDSSATAAAQVTTEVACTDGVVRTFYHSGSALSAGKLVTVSVTQSGTAVRGLSVKTLEGTVSKDGGSFAGCDFAAGVQILDTDDNGGYTRVYPSRLAGVKLSRDDVQYYTRNAAGEIDRMVLRNVTGDTQPYVYISEIDDNSSKTAISVSYTYVRDGQIESVSGGARYAVSVGGAMLVYEKGRLKSMRQLVSVNLDSLSSRSAMGDGREYKIAENVQVLLRDSADSQGYYLTDLSRINGEDYRLTGWYDNLGYSAGERIRIIVAAPK